MKRILAACALMPALSAWASDPSETCFNSLEARQSLAPLRSLIALGNIRNQTVDMMGNVRHPTLTEKAVIKSWVRERDRCFVLGDNWRQENMPVAMRAVLEDSYAKNKLLIADLYRARITYGEFGIRRAALATELGAGLDAAWHASRNRRMVDPALEAREDRKNAEARAAMLATATKAFEEEPLPLQLQRQSTGGAPPAECAGTDKEDAAADRDAGSGKGCQ